MNWPFDTPFPASALKCLNTTQEELCKVEPFKMPTMNVYPEIRIAFMNILSKFHSWAKKYRDFDEWGPLIAMRYLAVCATLKQYFWNSKWQRSALSQPRKAMYNIMFKAWSKAQRAKTWIGLEHMGHNVVTLQAHDMVYTVHVMLLKTYAPLLLMPDFIEEKEAHVHLQDPPGPIHCMVKHMYRGGALEPCNEETAIGLLALVDKYNIKPLYGPVAALVYSQVTETNCHAWYLRAEKHHFLQKNLVQFALRVRDVSALKLENSFEGKIAEQLMGART